MALVFGMVDPDDKRRAQTEMRFHARVRDLPWLSCQVHRQGHLTLLYAVCASTPVDLHRDANDTFSFLLGDLLWPDGTRATASQLYSLCKERSADILVGQGGFYLGLLREPCGAVMLSTDFLGLYPLYYFGDAETFCFASALGLLRAHPRCPQIPDPIGIAGLLLLGHGVNEHTIWKGLHRQRPGHLLRWQPGKGVREVRVLELSPEPLHEASSAENILDQMLHRLGRGLAQRGPQSLLLSGGLDSRTIAAYAQANGVRFTNAYTLGDSRDQEMRIARRVARAMGLAHRPISVDFDRYPDFAHWALSLEQLGTSFCDLAWWQGAVALHTENAPLLTGLLGDAVVAHSHVTWARTRDGQGYGFEAMFGHANQWGLPPETVTRLIRPLESRTAVDDAIASLRAEFEALPGSSWQKAYLFDLHHRQRLHVAPVAWRLSLAVWPLLPFADRRLVELCLRLPHEALTRRRAQEAVFVHNFPALASLPLDRNSIDNRPLVPTLSWRLKDVLVPWRWKRRRLGPRYERLYYHRVYDFENPGWRTLRAIAERGQPQPYPWLDSSVAEALLNQTPGLPVTPTVNNSAGQKTVLGLLLLQKENQSFSVSKESRELKRPTLNQTAASSLRKGC